MIWVAHIDICEDDIWFGRMTYHRNRLAAWNWLMSTMIECAKSGKKCCNPMIMRKKPSYIDPGQFEFLRGNEACAREWQDGLSQ